MNEYHIYYCIDASPAVASGHPSSASDVVETKARGSMSDNELCYSDATDLAAMIGGRRVSAVEVV
jgi:hypothetical protein